MILCDQLALRNGLRNSAAPWKRRSLTVTTTQLFAAAVAAITMSSGLGGRPMAGPSAMILPHAIAARSSKDRTRPRKRLCSPCGPRWRNGVGADLDLTREIVPERDVDL